MAQALISLKEKSRSFTFENEEPFSLPHYIGTLTKKIEKKQSKMYKELLPILSFLNKNLYPHYNTIPLTFSHGDPHPLNMIWGKADINAIIDWEFCGEKPLLYDIALIIGCVGTEDPQALEGGFITAFVSHLKRSNILTPPLIALLPSFLVAQRFAWLSEWLRREDWEMVDFELFYMEILQSFCCQ